MYPVKKKCPICGRLAEIDKRFCVEDSITIFVLEDIVETYLNAENGIVDSRISDAMKHFASLYLEDPFISILRKTGMDLINKFVLNPSTQEEQIIEEFSIKDFKFIENSFISLDLAIMVYIKAQILDFDLDDQLLRPGILLKRMINLENIGIGLRDSQFSQALNEYWGVFACALTLELINFRIKDEITRLPRIALGILRIISLIILKTLPEDKKSVVYDKISRIQINKALSKISPKSRRTDLLNRLLGIGIHRINYVLNDYSKGVYYLAPEVARLIEYERDNYRAIVRERY